MSIDRLVSPQHPCSHPGCRAPAQKSTYDSPNPLCYFHDESRNADRLRAAELARIAQKNKRHAPVPILDDLEQGAAETDRNHAKYQASEEARKREWQARGWSLEHEVVNGYRVPCSLPTCFCQPKPLAQPNLTVVLKLPEDPSTKIIDNRPQESQ
jgi:hypothetical protein